MVDFVKALIKNSLHIRGNPLLEFKCEVNTKTGELSGWQKATYKGLIFKSHDSGLLIISGSLHKYFNEGFHNWNQFSVENLRTTLFEIEDLFHLDLKECRIQNIEFGVNLNLPFSACQILDGLIEYKSSPFDSLHSGYYRQCKKTEYHIKVYDKGRQYRLEKSILRFELKFIKMRNISKAKCLTLSDLIYYTDWQAVKMRLLYSWRNIILFDSSIAGYDELETLRFSNPGYWSSLNTVQKCRAKKKLDSITRKHSKSFHWKTHSLLNQKINELKRFHSSSIE